MCGRTACTLEPDDIRRACTYKRKGRGGSGGKWIVPKWVDCPSGRTYHPSTNVAPTSHTPVLIAKPSSDNDDTKDKVKAVVPYRVVQPMYWSLVPSWHKGPLNELRLSTNNARFETLTEKPIFNVPLQNGRRCVVLSDGYYEWKEKDNGSSKPGSKQPYLIYFQQPNGIRPGVPSWKEDIGERVWSATAGWKGPRLLTMAGVYDISTDHEYKTPLYSYAVVTMDASKTMAFIHDRMPAILDGDDAVRDWLDYENVPLEKALELIVPVENLVYHPVSKAVGNSRNKGSDLVEAIETKKTDETESKSRDLMEKWLKTPPRGSKKRPSPDKGPSPKSKRKSE